MAQMTLCYVGGSVCCSCVSVFK